VSKYNRLVQRKQPVFVCLETSLDTIIYTDNKSTLLIVRCLNEKVKDFKVLTSEPTVTPETQTIILEKIKEAGFNPELLRIKGY
jgi:hypothetical protein